MSQHPDAGHWVARGGFPVVALLVLTLPVSASGQVAPSGSTPATKGVAEILAPYDGRDRPGVSVAIVQDGRLARTVAVGMADIDAGIPAEASTRFAAASVTKQFTAFAVALLERDGLVDLTRPIGTYLPELGSLGDRVTVSQLIHHTAGVKDYLGLIALSGRTAEQPVAPDEIVGLIASEAQLRHGAGEQFIYSNSHYVLLGALVERVSGRALGRFVAERILDPAGMANSYLVPARARAPGSMAVPHVADGAGYVQAPQLEPVPGPEGLVTTVEDLSRWAIALMRGQLGGGPVPGRIHDTATLPDGTPVPYAFGLSEDHHRGLRRYGHGGASPGWECSIQMYPDQLFAVVVMANAAVPAGRIARQIAEAFLHDEMPASDAVSSGLPPGGVFIDPEAVEVPIESKGVAGDTARYERYSGRYLMEEGPDMVVSTISGRLFLSIDYESPPVELFPVPDHRYRFVPATWDFTFGVDAAGATTITLHLGEQSIRRGPARDITGSRVVEHAPTPEELVLFEGCYSNDGLSAAYRVSTEAHGLVLTHPRLGAMPLEHRKDDVFGIALPPLRRAEFLHQVEADLNTPIRGLRLSAVAFGVSADFARVLSTRCPAPTDPTSENGTW